MVMQLVHKGVWLARIDKHKLITAYKYGSSTGTYYNLSMRAEGIGNPNGLTSGARILTKIMKTQRATSEQYIEYYCVLYRQCNYHW